MAYIGFDMDECLGCIWPIDEMVAFFTEGYTNDGQRSQIPYFQTFSEEFRHTLERGYWAFIARIAVLEQRGDLGVLRPGLIELFREIKSLKESGAVKATMIYSNNGRHANLRAVGDILSFALKEPTPFCAYIHYYHPYRKKVFFTEAKKFSIIQKAIEEAGCGKDVAPDNTLFIDDVIHPQIRDVIGPFGGYYNCKPYIYEVPQSILYAIFEEALEEVRIDRNPEFSLYCEGLFQVKADTLKEFLSAYRKKVSSPRGYPKSPAFSSREPGDRTELRDWFDMQIIRISNLGDKRVGGGPRRVRRGKGTRRAPA